MSKKILLRRGLYANLPTLSEGEPGFCTDTHGLYIGSADGNKRVNSHHINVQDKGANGDGITDDSSAIQNALTAAGTNGRIYFPKTANYYKAHNLTPLQGSILCGDWLGSIIKNSGGTTPIFNCTNGNIAFENLQINNSAPGGTDAGCIKWSGTINSLRIRNCWLADAYYGLKTAGGGEISILDSVLDSFDSGAIHLQGSYQVRVLGSYLGSAKSALLTGVNGATRTRSVALIGCEIVGNREDAVAGSSCDGLSIIGNPFNSNGQTTDNTYNSISLYDCTNVSILGNSGVADFLGSGKDVAYHVYFYANTKANQVRLFGNTWATAKTAEIYYAQGVIDAEVAHGIDIPNIIYNNAIPAAGTWKQGDTCLNAAAGAGGTPGWVCTSGGTPGTWKAMANLGA